MQSSLLMQRIWLYYNVIKQQNTYFSSCHLHSSTIRKTINTDTTRNSIIGQISDNWSTILSLITRLKIITADDNTNLDKDKTGAYTYGYILYIVGSYHSLVGVKLTMHCRPSTKLCSTVDSSSTPNSHDGRNWLIWQLEREAMNI